MRYYEGYYRLKKVVAGRMVEISILPIPIKKAHRSGRRSVRDKEKQRSNARAAIKKLAYLLMVNFTECDETLALTYSDLAVLTKNMPDELTADQQAEYVYRAAEKQLRLFFDRLRRACKKAGVSLRYIAATADMDGKTEEPKRIHHHVVINAEAQPYVERAWRNGLVKQDRLYNCEDGFPLAAYLLKQVRHRWNAKKYVTSRGLMKPQEICTIASSAELPELPAGAMEYERTDNSVMYLMPKRK